MQTRSLVAVGAEVSVALASQTGLLTGTQALVRNLGAHEILQQIMHARDVLGEWPSTAAKDGGREFTNIVMMGMGEPLYNYQNVSKALKICMDVEGLSISKRRITLSTSGVVPLIEKCGEELNVNLAISLHACNDELRSEIKDYGLIKLKEDKKIKKVVICSGKIYFDLLEAREKLKNDSVYFIRIEQLYPFPVKTLALELKRFRKKAKFYWCQEEPQNMGAWNSARNYIEWTLNHIDANDKEVRYIGRKPAASPATGYIKRHIDQQRQIVEKVLS